MISTRLFAGQHDHPRPVRRAARRGFEPVEGGLEDVYFSTLSDAPPRGLSGGRDMFLGIAGFEFRYQLRNPVFWVAIAIFFLLGFGDHRERERQHRHARRRPRERALSRSPVATAILTLFYLFVITAFVANAIVRDDSSGFAPIVRATPVTKPTIVLGRFLGGFDRRLARLSRGAARHVRSAR